MNIDFGILGKVVLKEIEPHDTKEGFTVVLDGYTEFGIRVHGFINNGKQNPEHFIWNNAVMFKVQP